MAPKKRLLVATDKADWVAKRQTLGLFKGLIVSFISLSKYRIAIMTVFTWMTVEEVVMPGTFFGTDESASKHIPHLRQEGESKQFGDNLLSRLQHGIPALKRNLNGSWSFMRAWEQKELPNRAPPKPPLVLLAITSSFIPLGLLDVAALMIASPGQAS